MLFLDLFHWRLHYRYGPVSISDWTVRNRVIWVPFTLFCLGNASVRKQTFDLNSVFMGRLACSVNCGGWFTDCIRSRCLKTGQPAETGHYGDKWKHHSSRWVAVSHSETQSPTVSWSNQRALALSLTPRDCMSCRSGSLASFAGNHNRNGQRTWQNNCDFHSLKSPSVSLSALDPVRQAEIWFVLLRAAATPSKHRMDSAKKWSIEGLTPLVLPTMHCPVSLGWLSWPCNTQQEQPFLAN